MLRLTLRLRKARTLLADACQKLRRRIAIAFVALDPASGAAARRPFLAVRPEEKRSILKFVLLNGSYRDGVVAAKLRQSFDLIAKTIRIAELYLNKKGYCLR